MVERTKKRTWKVKPEIHLPRPHVLLYRHRPVIKPDSPQKPQWRIQGRTSLSVTESGDLCESRIAQDCSGNYQTSYQLVFPCVTQDVEHWLLTCDGCEWFSEGGFWRLVLVAQESTHAPIVHLPKLIKREAHWRLRFETKQNTAIFPGQLQVISA